MSETDGPYEVTQPMMGIVPDEIEYVVDGVTYRYWDCQGKGTHSRIHPDVLLYNEKEVLTE
jgi:hypothetical protein